MISKAQEGTKWCLPNLLKLVEGSSQCAVKMRAEAKSLIYSRTGLSWGYEAMEDSVDHCLIICLSILPIENMLRTAYLVFPERDIQIFK